MTQEPGDERPEPSDEVKQLVAEAKIHQAVTLYREQTGADMVAAINAVGDLADAPAE